MFSQKSGMPSVSLSVPDAETTFDGRDAPMKFVAFTRKLRPLEMGTKASSEPLGALPTTAQSTKLLDASMIKPPVGIVSRQTRYGELVGFE